jgi:hypothetical protein
METGILALGGGGACRGPKIVYIVIVIVSWLKCVNLRSSTEEICKEDIYKIC